MRAILDTNMLISGEFRAPEGVTELAVTSISYAELQFGITATADRAEQQVRRRLRLEAVTARFGDGLPFDDQAALGYGHITELVRLAGRCPRGRIPDLMIAAIALSHGAALITRHGKDFAGVDRIVQVLRA
ncbi:PIN domain-containing protein [Rathayibacter soli]|uniref:PIN domain-containing protein n=1 Tax=Rathayibacter soli TaxID=3144168 RepID=UPI0027E5BA38|nr:PIN domain-containing protein [Glaciibacter superstes]